MLLTKIRREFLVALSKLGLKKATVSSYGIRYTIPLIHGMGRFLFVRSTSWRRKVMRTVADNENQAVLDIGVNVGQSLLDIKELLPKSTYYGFEPNPACVFYVNELIRLNDLPRSFVLPFGLSDREELMELKSRGWDDASSSVLERKGEHYATTIFTTRGDDFIKKQEPTNIAFIKIDTEGFEYFVIKGLSETIKKHIPVMFCEVHKDGPHNAKLFDLLAEWEYEVYSEGANLGSDRQSSANFENTFGNDYIFVHSSQAKGFIENFENQ